MNADQVLAVLTAKGVDSLLHDLLDEAEQVAVTDEIMATISTTCGEVVTTATAWQAAITQAVGGQGWVRCRACRSEARWPTDAFDRGPDEQSSGCGNGSVRQGGHTWRPRGAGR